MSTHGCFGKIFRLLLKLKEINGDEVLKLKTQIISEIYLESQLQPSLQIDVNHETHQKLLKSSIRIIQGASVPNDFVVFDEARANFCKELYDYWAGFKDVYKDQKEIPLTRQERQLRERLDEFLATKNPSPSDFKLPPLPARPQSRLTPPNLNAPASLNALPPASGSNTTVAPATASTPKLSQQQQKETSISIIFSISTGIKYKDERSNLNTAAPTTTVSPLLTIPHDRRNSVQIKSPSLLSANKA